MQNLAGVVREGDPMGEADQKNTNYTVIVTRAWAALFITDFQLLKWARYLISSY